MRLLRRAAESTVDAVGYAVRVDFREGDHDFWGWRNDLRRVLRLRQRYTSFFRGYGVSGFAVVAISMADVNWHRQVKRCRSHECPPARWPNFVHAQVAGSGTFHDHAGTGG
jgi:hypothetical protein